MTIVPSIVAVVHGPPGVGKSWLGKTTPAPRLVIDPEGGSRFGTDRKRTWDPMTQPVPEYDGTWETCIVKATSWEAAYQVLRILQTGAHPFRSVVLDSISELQRILVDDLAGIKQPTIQQYGQVLRSAEDFVRKLRDLSQNPVKPVECILILALTVDNKGVYKAAVSGKLQTSLPAFVDVVGYYYLDQETNPDTQAITSVRKLLIAAHPQFEAKDRTDILTTTFGQVITEPNLEEMLNVVAQLYV